MPNPKRMRRARSHRWLEDYTADDLKRLTPEAREYLRRFVMEYYYNTRSSNPDEQIHKGKDAMTEKGYGLYKAYNDAERDLMTKLLYPNAKTFVGTLVNVDAEVDRAQQHGDVDLTADELYAPTPSHEDEVLSRLDAEAWAVKNGVSLDLDEAGTSPRRTVAVINRQDGSKFKVQGTTYLNVRGIIVRDVEAADGSRLWPDDREAAVKALHEKRRLSQDRIVQKRSLQSK